MVKTRAEGKASERLKQMRACIGPDLMDVVKNAEPEDNTARYA